MNESKFRRLSLEHQKVILDAGREQHEYLKSLMTKEKEENLTFFKTKGLKILNPKDMAAWRARVKDFPSKYGHLWGEPGLFDQIQKTKY
jgi:TRAP-type C4-dicarboxylate transport system substrate-binding protein